MMHKETSLPWIYELVLLSIMVFDSESQFPVLSTHNIQHFLLPPALISFCYVLDFFSWEALKKDEPERQ